MTMMDLDEKAGLKLELSSDSDEESTSSNDKSSTQNETSIVDSFTNHQIARSETTAVNYSMYVVYLVIIFAAAGMAGATYWFTSNDENKMFKNNVSQHCVCLYLQHGNCVSYPDVAFVVDATVQLLFTRNCSQLE